MKELIYNILISIWIFPQNLLGFLIVKLFKAEEHQRGISYFVTKKGKFEICLGDYIIFGSTKEISYTDICHEHGHYKQSLMFGPLYLILIGLPSFLRYTYDRVVHQNWGIKKRKRWYYSGYPEKWADKLGKTKRFTL